MMHAVDVHLKRFDVALRHLVAAGEAHFAVALEFATQHRLLRLLAELQQ